MKRGIAVLLSLSVLVAVGYFTASKWAIRHETLTFIDTSRGNRPVPVHVAIRRDKEMQADAGMITLPVAVLNHGNTVKNTEYSFLANVFAARGYIALSPQHDMPGDPPMGTKPGELYVGRLPQMQRGVDNIHFALGEMKKLQPNADYAKVTMVGHSLGGDIARAFATKAAISSEADGLASGRALPDAAFCDADTPPADFGLVGSPDISTRKLQRALCGPGSASGQCCAPCQRVTAFRQRSIRHGSRRFLRGSQQ